MSALSLPPVQIVASRIGVFTALAVLALVPHPAFSAPCVVALYGPTKSQKFAEIQAEMRRSRVVEQMAEALSKGLRLPKPISLATMECGQSNAFYSPRSRAVVVCLELIGEISDGLSRDRSGNSPPESIVRSAGGALMAVLLHELGHALIHVLELPVLGREEDAADQISAYFFLNGNTQNAVFALDGALWFFRSKVLFYTRRHFSDEHSLGPQRQSNFACWAFGKNPDLYRYVLTAKYITPERAARCSGEYRQLSGSVRKLLTGHVELPTQ